MPENVSLMMYKYHICIIPFFHESGVELDQCFITVGYATPVGSEQIFDGAGNFHELFKHKQKYFPFCIPN
ncbi:hypothetical protein A3Q56_05727 [Intoshia linei]|uniref:Uncharacterized protein n=1 Tax=Intoshia linei TaxID=1819745 RepID=A0A177AWU2_9BILA|nr:hypothetical protein A3Q56_05727 [Intoshia linei]